MAKYLVAILPSIQSCGEENQQARLPEAKTRLETSREQNLE